MKTLHARAISLNQAQTIRKAFLDGVLPFVSGDVALYIAYPTPSFGSFCLQVERKAGKLRLDNSFANNVRDLPRAPSEIIGVPV